MSNNLNQPSYTNDEINLKKIIKIIIEFKKILISTLLIFTISGIIFSFTSKPKFISTVAIEVGHYKNLDGAIKIIESRLELMSHLKVFKFSKRVEAKFSQDVAITPFEKKLIKLDTVSNSSEQNETLLNEYISYILDRHNRLFIGIKNSLTTRITRDIDEIDYEISFVKSKLSDKNRSSLVDLVKEFKISIDNNSKEKLLNLSTININDKNKLFSLQKEKRILENQLNDYESQAQLGSQVINNILTTPIKPKSTFIIALSLISGFITGIFLVFIYKFIKDYKESET